MKGFRRLAIGCWLSIFSGTAEAQGLPAYAPINPATASRSGLATLPYVDAGRPWRFAVQLDYASVIEYAIRDDAAFVLDAEVLRLQVQGVRNLGKGFVLAEASLNGTYDGFLDGFLDWYHDIIGVTLEARELRPKNAFAYELSLPADRSYHYRSSSGFLGDLRLGAGLRHSPRWQSAVSVTLPVNTGPQGSKRKRPSFNLTTTLRSNAERRVIYEGTLSGGYTPKQGELSDKQQALFLMVTQGGRARVSGVFHAYANLIYHSAYYHDMRLRALDNRELSLDVGGMLRFKGGPEWIFGLVEDLEPSGPAVDVTFRFGARW